jgi:hypothetical protein
MPSLAKHLLNFPHNREYLNLSVRSLLCLTSCIRPLGHTESDAWHARGPWLSGKWTLSGREMRSISWEVSSLACLGRHRVCALAHLVTSADGEFQVCPLTGLVCRNWLLNSTYRPAIWYLLPEST